jgi:putative protein-disulfide isomerase
MVPVAYHTDPACPWSWALEPSVRKLMVEFSDQLRWTFVMGGIARSLVPEGSRASALDPPVLARLVIGWLEVSAETGAPLDPLVWGDSPIRTTYPACMAVKAAAEQAGDGGYRYLRRLREGLMCERRRLDHAEPLVGEARAAGLDAERFRLALGSNAITEAFAGDLDRTEKLAQRAGAVERASTGAGGCPLPAIVFGDGAPVAGFQPYEALREAAVAAGASPAQETPLGIEEAIARFGRLTTREVEALCGLPGPRAGAELYRLAEQWKLRPRRCLTGHLWETAG